MGALAISLLLGGKVASMRSVMGLGTAQRNLDSFIALETVAVVDDGPSALAAIRSGQPDLNIVDSHLFDEGTASFVRAVKQEFNGAHCAVVTDRLGQVRPILDAEADKVLLKGLAAADLAKALEQLNRPHLRLMAGRE